MSRSTMEKVTFLYVFIHFFSSSRLSLIKCDQYLSSANLPSLVSVLKDQCTSHFLTNELGYDAISEF